MMNSWLQSLTVVMVLSGVHHVTSQQECYTKTVSGSFRNFATLAECQESCANDHTCLSVDWQPTNAGKPCWILTSTTEGETEQNGDITHYTKNRTCLESYCSAPFQRTVVFMKFQSQLGEHLFYRGGIDYGRRPQCYSAPGQCLVPISHDLSRIPDTAHYTDYRTWAVGDTVLGWGGAEQGQSIASNGRAAGGTPAAWTTNDQSNTAAYHPLNKYGDHYWMVDLCMDCSATDNGWFEFKAYIENNNNWGSGFWENNVNQWSTCHGNVGGSRPYASGNHLARCGFVNMFVLQQGDCTINSF